jgi:hypothetical protein
LNHFMRAHGYLPGPTQRPVTAGLLSGIVALAPSFLLVWYSGALIAAANRTGVGPALAAAAFAICAALAGALYGRIFMRAANDRRGGWLFGIGFGFLLWMLGVGALADWLRHAPLATGRASQALFASHLLYGLVLGLAFPFLHTLIQRRSPWWRSMTPEETQSRRNIGSTNARSAT